jgi:hypothetical protein
MTGATERTLNFLKQMIQSHHRKGGRVADIETMLDRVLKSTTATRGLNIALLYEEARKYNAALAAERSGRLVHIQDAVEEL